jgi:hypothetical protein
MAWRLTARASVTAASVAALLGGCGTPEVIRRVAAAHPGATYEATATGCGSTAPASRRFGGDLRLAVLWSRETARAARQLPCEIVIDAVTGGSRQPVYRVRLAREGRTEGAVPP